MEGFLWSHCNQLTICKNLGMDREPGNRLPMYLHAQRVDSTCAPKPDARPCEGLWEIHSVVGRSKCWVFCKWSILILPTGDLSTLETEAPSEGKQAEGTPHVCQQCGASFRSRAALNGHKLAHVGLRPFPCPACPRAFSSSGAAARHLRNIHKRSPVFDSVLPDVPQEQQLSGDTEAC